MWGSLVILMVSIARKDGATEKALGFLEADPLVSRVVMRGDCPLQYYSKVECKGLVRTDYHHIYRRLPEKYIPTRFVEPGKSWGGTDDLARVKWRTQLNLDALAALIEIQSILQRDQPFVFLENDVRLHTEKLPKDKDIPYSCWSPYHSKLYGGSGALCFVFKNDDKLTQLIQCLVAKHMIIPFDWLVYDCFSKMPAVHAASDLGRISTRVQ